MVLHVILRQPAWARSTIVPALVLAAFAALATVPVRPVWAVEDAAATRFTDSIADLPLAPGLVEQPGTAVLMDKPQGRIVELLALGPVDAAAAVAFYRETLPALGWAETAAPGADLAFTRAAELLTLRMDTVAAGAMPLLTVQFSIAPR